MTKIDKLIHTLQTKLDFTIIKLDDVDSVLGLLYNAYYDQNCTNDSDEIKQAFDQLYQVMNGKTLREMDELIYSVCTLCRNYQKTGFSDGIKLGFLLTQEQTFK